MCAPSFRFVSQSGFFAAFRMTVMGAAALCASLAPAADVRPRMLLLDAAFAGPDLVAVGERGTILRSPDNARTWQRVASVTRATLTAIAFAPEPGAKTGWAVGHDALILATNDGGRTWSKQYQGDDLQDSFLDVLALDATHAIAVGAYGLFAQTRDAGKTWARRKIIPDDAHLNRISRSPAGTLYLAGEHGTLLRSSDRGETWQPIPAPYDGSLYGVLALDARTLLAYGIEGRVFHSADDGATWTRVSTPAKTLLATGTKLKGGAVFLAGEARTLLASTDAAKSFVPPPATIATAIAELIELPDGNLLAVGEAGATVIPMGR